MRQFIVMAFFCLAFLAGCGGGSSPAGKVVETLLSPNAPTADDWKRVKISPGTIADGQIPYWFLTYLRPVLDADTNTNAPHTRATNKRDGARIITTIWSNKIINTLHIDWSNGKVDKEERKFDEGPRFSEDHDDQKTIVHPTILFGFNPLDRSQSGIGIDAIIGDKKHSSFIPYKRENYSTMIGFISKDYSVAVLPKITKEGRVFESLLVVDVLNDKILGDIKRPEGTQNGMPNFILDKENDILLVLQFGLDWMIAIDLMSYIAKVRKSQ